MYILNIPTHCYNYIKTLSAKRLKVEFNEAYKLNTKVKRGWAGILTYCNVRVDKCKFNWLTCVAGIGRVLNIFIAI